MTTIWPLEGEEPKPVQLEAIKASGGRRGFAYFMDMGLGKTGVIYAEFVRLFLEGKVDGMIVVSPFSLMYDWIAHQEQWGVTELFNSAIWPNFPEKNKTPFLQVINYEAFAVGRAKAKDILPAILRKYRVFMVIDESVQIKRHDAKRTKALIALCREATYVRLLSGLPNPQGPHDLWSQFQAIGAIPGMNYFHFRNKFCRMGGFKGKVVKGPREDNKPILDELIEKNAFVAAIEDWSDLEWNYDSRFIDMTDAQKKIYKEMADDFITMVDDTVVEVELVISAMIKLQQISCGFIYDENRDPILIPGPNPKLLAVQQWADEILGKKIIFGLFRHTCNLLIDSFPNCARIVGGMSPKEVAEEKERFNKGDAQEIICQIDSAKYGHTLIGEMGEETRCKNTAFFENGYNLDSRKQAERRNLRWGQDQKVIYTDFIASPIDRKAVTALQLKLDVAKSVLNGVKNGEIQRTR